MTTTVLPERPTLTEVHLERGTEESRCVEAIGEVPVHRTDTNGVFRSVAQHVKEREEDRHLHEHRQTRRERVCSAPSIEGHGLATHRLARKLVALAFVLCLYLFHLRCEIHHAALRFNLLHRHRDKQRSHDDHEPENCQHPSQTTRGIHSQPDEKLVPQHEHGLDKPPQWPQDGLKKLIHLALCLSVCGSDEAASGY